MSTEPAPPPVTHNTTEFRFEMAIGEAIAQLEYSMNASIMTIHHTYVPDAGRGKGVAGHLAKAAFDFARYQQLKVIPACSYITAYARRHPEAAELI